MIKSIGFNNNEEFLAVITIAAQGPEFTDYHFSSIIGVEFYFDGKMNTLFARLGGSAGTWSETFDCTQDLVISSPECAETRRPTVPLE